MSYENRYKKNKKSVIKEDEKSQVKIEEIKDEPEISEKKDDSHDEITLKNQTMINPKVKPLKKFQDHLS